MLLELEGSLGSPPPHFTKEVLKLRRFITLTVLSLFLSGCSGEHLVDSIGVSCSPCPQASTQQFHCSGKGEMAQATCEVLFDICKSWTSDQCDLVTHTTKKYDVFVDNAGTRYTASLNTTEDD